MYVVSSAIHQFAPGCIFGESASYLELKRQGGIFPRRQDLPPEACASAADVRRWGDEIRATLALRKKFTKGEEVEEIQHGPRFPPFVVTSYAWCAATHACGPLAAEQYHRCPSAPAAG